MRLLVLLRRPQVVRLLVTALLGRIPAAAAALAISLVLRDAGFSFSQVGVVVGAFGVSMAVGGPLLGRIVDHRGQFAVLTLSSAASSVGLVTIALAPTHLAPVLIGAAVAGVAAPPLEACLRALWPRLVREDEMDQALSLDAAAQELVFIASPLIVTASVAIADPALALWLLAGLSVAGTLVFALTPSSRTWVPVREEKHWLGPLTSGGFLGLLSALLFSGAAIGAVTLFFISYAENHPVTGGAGLLLALNGAGALLGALTYGSVTWRLPLRDRLAFTTASMAAVYWLLTVTPGPSWMLALSAATGVFLAPTLAASFSLVSQVIPGGVITEAFAWIITVFTVGSALGSFSAGFAMAYGLAAVGAVAAVAATLSAVVVLVGRSLWTPASRVLVAP